MTVILDDFGLQTWSRKAKNDPDGFNRDKSEEINYFLFSNSSEKWYDLIPEKTIADAILDRIIPPQFDLKSKESMRKSEKNL
jgi:DNA replication protein DnaC